MPLPHFTNVTSHFGDNQGPFEAVYPGLFEISFVLPAILVAQNRDPLMLLENATNVSGFDLTATIGEQVQRFKYSTRVYLPLPEKTHTTFDINFNVNVNHGGSMYTWNTLRSWYDLLWNSQVGTNFYKRDMVGTVIVNQHDKKGFIIRRITFHNTQIKGIDGQISELDWEKTNNIVQGTKASFVCDYWTDEWIDPNYAQLLPPLSV